MVLAEKIVTAIQRGVANTRWRDFVDIDSIARLRAVTQVDLLRAMTVVAEHRQTTLHPLAVVLTEMADSAQPKWQAWRRRQRLEQTTPELFQELLDRCVTFVDPVLTPRSSGLTWSPAVSAWV